MCTTNTSVHTNYYRKQFYCNNAEFLYLFGTKWAESAMAIESLNVVTDWWLVAKQVSKHLLKSLRGSNLTKNQLLSNEV